MRNRAERFKDLPPEEQQRLREEYRRYRELPPEQRQQRREQWQQMSPEERDAVRDKDRAKAEKKGKNGKDDKHDH